METGMKCVKYLLFTFNLIFAVSIHFCSYVLVGTWVTCAADWWTFRHHSVHFSFVMAA